MTNGRIVSSLHVRRQLLALNAEELVEQPVFVLADVDEECAGGASQRAVIALVLDAEIFDGVVDAGAHDQRALRQVELVELRQKVLVLGVLLVAILDELDDPLDLRRRRLELAVEHRESGF
jgi:hypothetical protein